MFETCLSYQEVEGNLVEVQVRSQFKTAFEHICEEPHSFSVDL